MHKYIFKETLYKEHLEEGGFQYETRINWLKDKAVSWLELEPLDHAIEAHLDALVLGANHALKVALEYAPEAEPGELHIIVRLFCRHELIDRLSQLWASFDFDNTDNINAVADALKWECPASWQSKLAKVFTQKNDKMYPIVAPSIAALSPSSTANLLTALNPKEHVHNNVLLNSIAKSGTVGDSNILYNFINQTEDKTLIAAAIRCLLIRQDTAILAHFEKQIEHYPLLFAIGGNQTHSNLLITVTKKQTATTDCLLALGLMGYIDSIPILLNYLKHPTLNKDAAQALYIMSGAPLFEDQHQPEKIDKDELFEHEIKDLKEGKHPKNIDGIDYGIETNELSIDYPTWFTWFQKNKNQFVKNERYRFGKTPSQKSLVDNLIGTTLSTHLRNLTYDELVIRYNIAQPFFTDDPIYKQKMQLNALYTQVNINA